MFNRVGSLPSHLRMPSQASKTYAFLLNNLNFYRIHLLAFTFIPLIFSGIMYGISTQYQISYIDCLFNCMSAMTVTGLATVNLSTMSAMQQVLLFFQMTIGSLTFVSILMIMVRLHFFRQKFKHVIQDLREKERERREREGAAKGFSLSRTMSRVNPAQGVRNVKRRLSMGFPTKEANDYPPRINTAQNGHTNGHALSPSSFEMKGISPAPPYSQTDPDLPPRAPTVPIQAQPQKGSKKRKLKINKDMIKRVEGGGVGMMNPMGWYDDSPSHSPGTRTPVGTPRGFGGQGDMESPKRGRLRMPEIDVAAIERGRRERENSQSPVEGIMARSTSDPDRDNARPLSGILGLTKSTDHADESAIAEDDEAGVSRPVPRMVESPHAMSTSLPDDGEDDPKATKTPYAGRILDEDAFPRAKTIAFEDDDDGLDHDRANAHAQTRGFSSAREGGFFPRTATGRSASNFPRSGTTATFPRTYSLHPSVSRQMPISQPTKYSDFGGFPTPIEIGRRVFKKAFPERHRTLTTSLSMPRTNTIGRKGTVVNDTDIEVQKEVPYISFAAVVGRNSRFTGLTEEQMDELGGVEYRALRVLFWIVVGYYVFVQLAAFVIMAPYIAAQGRYNYVFDTQPQQVTIPWFALFQTWSAFSNTGMSLVDQSMIPFQTAYLMSALIVVLIFAGNTAYPVFLRMTVWTIYKIVPRTSQIHESLKFLLDHPRRCFVYLFPATQTWVLACVMIGLYSLDFVCFLVLDIGTEQIQEIPVGTRIGAAFLQSAAVRAAGFAIVPIAALAPAVKVLYVVMMYVSVYPIALSVRSTNVYEEKSLGLFEEEEEEELEYGEKGASAVAKYVGWHARRQLAFDIWWLGFALWLLCVVERTNIIATDNESWFNIFSIIFEIVSAYGTVGLSLGVPYDNYSFVGAFGVLGKLIVTLVMLRGRHRGLPVAIDRAVMCIYQVVPKDFTAEEEQAFEETRSRRASRRESSIFAPELMTASGRQGSSFSHTSPRRQSSFDPQSVYPHDRSHSGGSGAGDGGRRTSSPGPTHSPPAMIHNRSASMSVPTSHTVSSTHSGMMTTTAATTTTASPAGLTFNLPTNQGRRSDERPRVNTTSSGSGGANASGGGGGGGSAGLRQGQLSPVKESALSREPTIRPPE